MRFKSAQRTRKEVFWLTYLYVTVLAGQVERRGTLVGASIDVCTVADQQAGEHRVTMQGSHMQRRETVKVTAVYSQRSCLQDTHLHRHTYRVRTNPLLHLLILHFPLTPYVSENSWDTGREGDTAEPEPPLHSPLSHLSIRAGNAPTHTVLENEISSEDVTTSYFFSPSPHQHQLQLAAASPPVNHTGSLLVVMETASARSVPSSAQ